VYADLGSLLAGAVSSAIYFKGHWRNPEETKNAFTPDGWFRTGDIGRIDEDGWRRSIKACWTACTTTEDFRFEI